MQLSNMSMIHCLWEPEEVHKCRLLKTGFLLRSDFHIPTHRYLNNSSSVAYKNIPWN